MVKRILTDEEYTRLGKRVEHSNVLEALRLQTIALREYLAEISKSKAPSAKPNEERLVMVSTRLIIANQNAEKALLTFLHPETKPKIEVISDLIAKDIKP